MSESENIDEAVKEQPADFSDKALTAYEKIVLFFLLSVVTTIFIIAIWSAILLFLGDVEGGGPLGLLMRILPLELFL